MPAQFFRISWPFIMLMIPWWVVTDVQAQFGHPVDSLIASIGGMPEDTFRVNTLLDIANRLYRKSDFDASRTFASEALKLAEKIDFKRGQAFAHNFTGISYRNQGQFEQAIQHYQKAFSLWQALGDKRNMAGYHMNMGIIHSQLDLPEKALEDYSAAEKVFKELNHLPGLSATQINLGITHKNMGHYGRALDCYQNALQFQEALHDQLAMGNTYAAMGVVYEIQGQYPEAISHTINALRIYENIENQSGICSAMQELGNIYYKNGNLEDALEYFTKALTIAKELGNPLQQADLYNNIGHIALTQHQPALALTQYASAKDIYSANDDLKGLGETNQNLGAVYMQLKDYPQALEHFSSALPIMVEIGDPESITTLQLNLGKTFTLSGDYTSATFALDTALMLSQKYGYLDMMPDVYLAKVVLDSMTGQPQQGLEHLKRYIQYKDSLFTIENSRIIHELQARYETEKKEQAILNLENDKALGRLQLNVQEELLHRTQLEKDKAHADNLFNLQQITLLDNEKKLQQLALDKKRVELDAQQSLSEIDKAQLKVLSQETEIQQLRLRRQNNIRNYLIGSVIALLMLGLFMYNNYVTRQQLKLQKLRNKIASDLHDDVGSTLSSISIFSEMAQKQSKEVIPMLETIGDSSRKMLDAMADIVWTINPENDQFENVLLRMRSFAYTLLGAKKIDFEFEAEDDLATLKLPMDVRKNLYLIFKEAANNMAKYSDASLALFSIKEEKKELIMTIHDNGKGFDTSLTSSGNGLKNMQRRASEIGASLQIQSIIGKGTTIEFRIAV